eukprot:7376961-Prymnesium_polylepis.2
MLTRFPSAKQPSAPPRAPRLAGAALRAASSASAALISLALAVALSLWQFSGCCRARLESEVESDATRASLSFVL